MLMHAKRSQISQFTCHHDGGAEGANWSLEVVLETISVKANRDMADVRERRFRGGRSVCFFFAFSFSALARRISSARACGRGEGRHFKSTG